MRHLFREKLKDATETLANIFLANWYNTAAIVSCPGMNSRYWFNKWFNLYDDEIPRLADGSDPLQTIDMEKRWTAIKRANVVSDRAITRLNNNQQKPFFLFLHFFDAHRPYEAPEKFWWENCYEEEVAFSLHYLSKVINRLKELWIYDTTSIVCFSDHWEDLNWLYPNDKGWEKLWHPEEKWHWCLLYDQTQKVVLTMKDEKILKWGDIIPQVRLIDLLPTILDLFNFENNLKLDWISLVEMANDKKYLDLIWYSETYYPEEQKWFYWISNKKSYRIGNKYKIIENIESWKNEIYELKKDELELNNLLL